METKLNSRESSTELAERNLADVWSQMDRLFDSFRDDFYSALTPVVPGRLLGADTALPALLPALADIEDTGTGYEIRANLPGIPKENIDVQVQGNLLQIRGEVAKEQNESVKSFVRQERVYQGFQRLIQLPEPVLEDKVEARFADGVLTVKVPKAHPVRHHKVQVS